MDSPLHIGDITTNSIQTRLDGTHLTTTALEINSASYLGQKYIQLVVTINKQDLAILRRIEDSYVNVTQLFQILVKLGILKLSQVDNFLSNEILTNSQYLGTAKQFIDFREHETLAVRGLWIPYDKAVSLAIKFDIYELTKMLFLVDVHEFDNLPKSNKRIFDELEETDQSPSKKPKLDQDVSKTISSLAKSNNNFPFTLPPIELNNQELITEFKLKFGQVFKSDNDDNKLSFDEVKAIFQPVIDKYSDFMDIPLDVRGQTALHFAATLASSNLVSSFIKLGLNSPIRGNADGESPLISTIQVTNSMEKGNFLELLSNWLYPNLWLYDTKSQSILHHLVLQSNKKIDSVKFYATKIIEFIISNDQYLHDLLKNLVNLQDTNGNTCLHLAVEAESKWFIKLFLLLQADAGIANKEGIRPHDFEIVKETDKLDFKDQTFDLVKTSVEFLNKRLEIDGNLEIEPLKPIVKQEPRQNDDQGNSSSKIFQSIQDLLTNTNNEYDMILNNKREQIANLNKALHGSTIVTANNRYILKTIAEKLADLDNIKLQMANINDKLQSSKQEIPELKDENYDDAKSFDADEPFIIKPLYNKIVNDESVDDLKTEEFIESLQPASILQARIAAYKQVNSQLETELDTLLNYSELTSKFKKIVSICTGVDINEVDEYLDGLLEAVEVQQ